MLKQKVRKFRLSYLLCTFLFAGVFALATFYNGMVKADQFDQQIQALQSQNATQAETSQQLGAQASSYQDQVNQLASQIDGLQQAIVSTQQQSDATQVAIDQKQADLDQQKKVLGEDIKQMYLEGQISPLEILASSGNLSDYVNKEVDRSAVQNKVKSSVDQINILKLQLQQKELELQDLIKSQQAQQAQLQSSESQQSQLLAYTEEQKATADATIKANNSAIVSLRAQQFAANHRLISGGGVSIVYGGGCGGGYPGDAVSNFGHWGCNYAQDNTLDNWGLYNRECVSYTAWKVYQAYGFMPYWGGSGNADQWPGDADAYNIPRDNNPTVGSVAIGTNPSYFGSVGHAMWVEAVNGDGTIVVSQYNFGQEGQYSEMTINASLITTFIHFGG
jgi:peptidoglycan DL-endopeptidase CwlO